MNYIYHRVREDMKGTVLYPLNSLRDIYPELYQNYVQKYAGREHIMEQYIPTLDCLWNDVIHFSPVDPREIVSALNKIGISTPEMSFYQIEADALDFKNATIYLNNNERGQKMLLGNFVEYNPCSLRDYDELPSETIEYYKKMFEQGVNPLLFVRIPHVLYKRVFDIKDFPTITIPAFVSDIQPLNEKDPWRSAILMERQKAGFREMLKKCLDEYKGPRDNALILGDACLVQSRFFLEQENFVHVVDVDSSPTLLDDDILSKDDARIERVLSDFDAYDPGDRKFDVIYGKSIAFNPKNTIIKLMSTLCESLNSEGIFYAEWASEGDMYRDIYYTQQELEEMYDNAGFKIIKIVENDKIVKGLIRKGRSHDFYILAIKK